MSSSFGKIFTVTTFGESHGPGIGVVIDGCPPGLLLNTDYIQFQLDRRKPGQSKISTPRKENDSFEILSGVYEGKTLGTPIMFLVRNEDAKSHDYMKWADVYRPSHADYTYDAKYGHRTPAGGGRASARETIGRVIAGAVAAQFLKETAGIEIIAYVDSVGPLVYEGPPPVSIEQVESNPVRCPDPALAASMEEYILSLKEKGDSTGGTVRVLINNVPPGLGDPVFDRLEADLGKACLSIPACKAFESGSGFAGSRMTGSQHNDLFFPGSGGPVTRTNHSGGIQGGISNGMPITLRLGFKPTATIRIDQETVNNRNESVILKAGGRHDPCVAPRAVPVAEAMVSLVLMDAFLRQRAIRPDWLRNQ